MNENDTQPPPPGPLPPPPLGQTQEAATRGSMLAGYGLALLILIGGHVLMFWTTAHVTAFAAQLLPELVTLILAIYFFAVGKPRTGVGLLLGLATVFAIVLLLIAACFGLLSNARI